MIKTVYLDPRFEKQIRLLRRAGKKAALAADKADEIIARLRSGESMPTDIGSTTRHGELRIRGCIKFDLGSGYRLITFKQRNRIFLLYVGSHDGCDRWLENNRESAVDQIKKRCTMLTVDAGEITAERAAKDLPDAMTEKNHDHLAHVAEKDLRLIFRGLVDGAA